MLNYFQNIFQTEGPININMVTDNIPCVITESMNASLSMDFLPDEVEIVVKQMAPLTAPGPDGLPPLFYQTFWPLIGNDVVSAVLSSLNTGQILPAINHTYHFNSKALEP